MFYNTNGFLKCNNEIFRLIYIKKGNIDLEIEGYSRQAKPNDIIIIKPNQLELFILKADSKCECIVLNFELVNKFESQLSSEALGDFLDFVSGKESGIYIVMKASQKSEIILLLNRIFKEKENPDLGSEFLIYISILRLFVLITRALKMEWEISIKEKNTKIKEIIKASVNYINHNFEKNITLKDISSYVFLSSSYLAKAFKCEMGISPINYLLRLRIEKSKKILRDTDHKMSDISLSVGFSNQQRFNDIFKKYTKYTPLQYRNMYR